MTTRPAKAKKKKPRDWIRVLPRPKRVVKIAPDLDTYDLHEAARFHEEDEIGDVGALASSLESIPLDGEACTDAAEPGQVAEEHES